VLHSPSRLHRPEAVTERRVTRDWVDRFIGSDPGLNRLRTALQVVVTIAVTMLAEWLFVRLTHALQISTPPGPLAPATAALVAAQHHGVLVIGILLGAVTGLIASFTAGMFATPRIELQTFALMPVPMTAGICLGLALAPYRLLSLAALVVALALGAYLRRFGAPGFITGMLLFMGDFFGFFLKSALHFSGLGWVVAEIYIGALVAIIAQFTLFYPSSRRALARMRRSYAARSRQVIRCALALFDESLDSPRAGQRLHRQLVRLNETALMIDAALGDPAASAEGSSATVLHQRLFDVELSLTNVARFAERIAHLDTPAQMREQVRAALQAVEQRDYVSAELRAHDLVSRLREETLAGSLDRTAHVVTHRFAVSLLGLVEAVQAWPSPSLDPDASDPALRFTPSVTLLAGWLPGSAMVSAQASLEGGRRSWRSFALAPNVRASIQMMVAVTLAIVVGDIVSGRRFYWAVIAVFATYMGVNNAGEQIRKGVFRVSGTVIGVLLGAALVHVVGHHTDWSIAVILAALFLGVYLMRINYFFFVVAITITVSQLYVQLDEFTDSLLGLRLAETAIGATIAALTVLCVLPLHTSKVARLATRQYLTVLGQLCTQASQRLQDPGQEQQLRATARSLDAAHHSLLTTIKSMGVPFVSSDGRTQWLSTIAASRHYARNLLTDTAAAGELAQDVQDELGRASDRLTSSIAAIGTVLEHGRPDEQAYVRSASLFAVVAAKTYQGRYTEPVQLALRDLELIDGAMANLARSTGLSVTDLDSLQTDHG
jgi:hypothetical protein